MLFHYLIVLKIQQPRGYKLDSFPCVLDFGSATCSAFFYPNVAFLTEPKAEIPGGAAENLQSFVIEWGLGGRKWVIHSGCWRQAWNQSCRQEWEGFLGGVWTDSWVIYGGKSGLCLKKALQVWVQLQMYLYKEETLGGRRNRRFLLCPWINEFIWASSARVKPPHFHHLVNFGGSLRPWREQLSN